MNLNNTYFGFTDKMKPMQKAKVEKLLDKLIRYNDKVITKKEFNYLKLKEGSTLEIEKDFQYCKRNGELTKPKTEYRLCFFHPEYQTNCYNEISKTEYEFCQYILDNGFLDEQKAEEFIATEQDRLQKEEQERIEQEQRRKEDQEKMQQENINFDQWLTEAAENYPNNKNLQILDEVFTKRIGGYSSNTIKLLVLIDNFDDPQCKEKIREWLAYFNTASIKTFETITGIKLGKTDKAIQAKLDQITSADFRKIA